MSTVLHRIIDSGKIPQSILIHSTHESDALALAKQLFGEVHEPKIDSGNHPDFHLYAPDEKSDLHPIANIQKLIREMALPPFESKIKIFAILEAEKMLPPSSNALLKTLEEPAEDAYFLLLTNHPDRLLPTIHSRLHPITIEASGAEPRPKEADLTPLFKAADLGDWAQVLEILPSFEGEDPPLFFSALLAFVGQRGDAKAFALAQEAVNMGQKALESNLKPRTVFLNTLLSLL